MSIFQWANQKVKKFTWMDVKLLPLAGICVGLVLAKLIPSILGINIWWFVVIGILALLKPYYTFFKK